MEGCCGPAVEFVQEIMEAKLIDGVFGSETKQCVTEFQSGNELNADGIVGQQTWKAIVTK